MHQPPVKDKLVDGEDGYGRLSLTAVGDVGRVAHALVLRLERLVLVV